MSVYDYYEPLMAGPNPFIFPAGNRYRSSKNPVEEPKKRAKTGPSTSEVQRTSSKVRKSSKKDDRKFGKNGS